MKVWMSALSILFSIQIPVADQSPVAVVRDSQAIAVIQQSISALGGTGALTQVQTVIAQGSIVSAKGANGLSGNFVWEDQFAAKNHEFKASFQSASDTQLFVSGHGNPGLVSNGKTTKFTPYVASTSVPIHLPGVVLLGLLANTDFKISFVGSVALKGQPRSRFICRTIWMSCSRHGAYRIGISIQTPCCLCKSITEFLTPTYL